MVLDGSIGRMKGLAWPRRVPRVVKPDGWELMGNCEKARSRFAKRETGRPKVFSEEGTEAGVLMLLGVVRLDVDIIVLSLGAEYEVKGISLCCQCWFERTQRKQKSECD